MSHRKAIRSLEKESPSERDGDYRAGAGFGSGDSGSGGARHGVTYGRAWQTLFATSYVAGERRFRVYKEAPGFRHGPRVMSRALWCTRPGRNIYFNAVPFNSRDEDPRCVR